MDYPNQKDDTYQLCVRNDDCAELFDRSLDSVVFFANEGLCLKISQGSAVLVFRVNKVKLRGDDNDNGLDLGNPEKKKKWQEVVSQFYSGKLIQQEPTFGLPQSKRRHLSALCQKRQLCRAIWSKLSFGSFLW